MTLNTDHGLPARGQELALCICPFAFFAFGEVPCRGMEPTHIHTPSRKDHGVDRVERVAH